MPNITATTTDEQIDQAIELLDEATPYGVWATGSMGATWAKIDGKIYRASKREAEEQAALWNDGLSGLSSVRYTAAPLDT
jgi:hypothetical protein